MTALADLPVTDVWWVRERVDDAITLVTEPHVHPFLRCNVWHVRGRDADLVIDTGMGIRPLRPFVERELDGPLIVVATHAHSDHVGGLQEFEQRAVHAAEADTVAEAQLAAVDTSLYGDTTPPTPGRSRRSTWVWRSTEPVRTRHCRPTSDGRRMTGSRVTTMWRRVAAAAA